MEYAYLKLPAPSDNRLTASHEPPRLEGRPAHEGYAYECAPSSNEDENNRGVIEIQL